MTEKYIPRIAISGASSGSGKTTVTCAVLSLLLRKGIKTSAFKCGPDYIDPMFHRAVTGVDCTNLDPFFCDKDTLCRLLSERSEGYDISVIEGVMGYYDGTGKSGILNSTYTVANMTETPVILVVNAKGASASLLATIDGFLNFVSRSQIAGIIFNNVTEMTFKYLAELCDDRFGGRLSVVGYLPKLDEKCIIGSRHLGLITANEITDLRERLEKLADIAEKTIDIEKILELSKNAPNVFCTENNVPKLEPIRIAYTKDNAFCFSYGETLSLFEKMGAELVPFSPLENEAVPACDGLYLFGGYPELYLDKLEKNTVSRESVRLAVENKTPTIAECGGFMYLGMSIDGKTMCSALPHESTKTEKLVRFGYVTLTAKKDGLLGEFGDELRAHEFHYWDSTDNGQDFTAEKTNGRRYDCAIMTDSLYAGYPHIYLYSNQKAAERFYRECLKFKHRRDEK